MDEDKSFTNKLSSTTCLIDDIQGIIFGPGLSRFWMMRKHINLASIRDLKNLPFFSWEILTIILPHREVNLVIKSKPAMDRLLKYLILRLKTIDGRKNSAM